LTNCTGFFKGGREGRKAAEVEEGVTASDGGGW
jgi:hypothetical protein